MIDPIPDINTDDVIVPLDLHLRARVELETIRLEILNAHLRFEDQKSLLTYGTPSIDEAIEHYQNQEESIHNLAKLAETHADLHTQMDYNLSRISALRTEFLDRLSRSEKKR